MNLAIIIPALNEEDCIASTLGRIPQDLARQIIVVDNGSSDQTAARARRAGAAVVFEPHRGYGHACLAGLAKLGETIDTVAFLDADGSDDPKTLANMLELIESGDAAFILSARVLGDAKKHLSPPQRFGNWISCFLIHLIWCHRFVDCGPMRMIRRDALEQLQMTDTTWGWNVEMQIKAARNSLKVIEIPVTYGQRTAGKSKISGNIIGTVRAGIKILATIIHHALA